MSTTERDAHAIAASIWRFAHEHGYSVEEAEATIHHMLTHTDYPGDPHHVIRALRARGRPLPGHEPLRFHRGRVIH